MAANNKLLGQFDLVGIPPAPRGMPQVEVTFDIDANGIVNVSAKDKATGKEQQIRIQASGGLSKDDIDRMVQEAEDHAAEDKERREGVEVTNQAEALVNATEKNLEEFDDKIGADDKKAIQDTIKDLKAALEEGDADKIKEQYELLSKVAMKLGEAMYGQSGGAPGGEEGNDNTGEDGDVVDADFEEVKEGGDDDKKQQV